MSLEVAYYDCRNENMAWRQIYNIHIFREDMILILSDPIYLYYIHS